MPQARAVQDGAVRIAYNRARACRRGEPAAPRFQIPDRGDAGDMRLMIFRSVAGVMATLLAFAAALNFNDPDAVRWVAIYGAACAVSIATVFGADLPVAAPAAVAVIALVWGVVLAARGPGFEAYTHMFETWEMKSPTIEVAREACGLFIVAAWMAVVTAVVWQAGR
jgi:hypothetical protein